MTEHMDSDSSSNEDLFAGMDLQHPEILSLKQLCHLFQKRQIPVAPHQASDKNELLQLYYRTLMPLPQRDFKPNRRGQLLNAKRKKLMLQRKEETSSNHLQDSETSKRISKVHNRLSVESTKSSSESKLSSHNISLDRKTIRFSDPVNGINTASKSSKRTESPNSSQSNPRSKIIKLINETITSNKKGSNSHSNSKKDGSDSHSNSKKDATSCKRSETSSANESAPPKKKHKPITWP